LLQQHDSYELSHMGLRFSFLFLALLLGSCSFSEQSPDIGSTQVEKLPVADARGVNTALLNRNVEELMKEAMAIEGQIDAMISRLNQIQNVIQGYNQEAMTANDKPQVILPVPEREVVTKQPQRQKVAQSKPVSNATSQILSKDGVNTVRIGAHSDKTRIVFDIKGSTKHSVNFDQEAGVLTITMPDTPWSTTRSRTYRLSQIDGYEAKSSNNGTIIAIAVKNTSDIKTFSLSNPNRLVIDLKK